MLQINNQYRYGLLLFAIFIFSFLVSCKKLITIEIEEVKRRTIISRVSESGTILPEIEVPIAADVSGEVTALYVKEGDYVRKGDLLFTIRPDNYIAALEQSKASLNSAKAEEANADANLKLRISNLKQDSINFKRNEDLFQNKVISQSEFENFRLQYDISKANLEAAKQTKNAAYFRVQSAEATIKRSKDDLNRTSVYASMDGTITSLAIEVGQRVVGTGMMSGTETMKIADLTKMKVKVSINENDIVNIRIGDTATIIVDALKDKEFKGSVSDIAYSANVAEMGTTDQVTNYEVKVLIDPNSYKSDSSLMRNLKPHQSPLRPGMSAVVNIFTQRSDHTISAPITSITINKEETKDTDKPIEAIYVCDTVNKIVSLKNVSTGISDDNYIEIKEGLKVTDIIVAGPYNTINKELKDGIEVQIEE